MDALPRRQGAGEAQLVAISVVDVEVALAPWCVRGRGFRIEPRRERASVHRVHVVDPEHDSTPDGPSGRTDRVELKVEVAGADPEARERRLRSSVEQMEAERFVEDHGVTRPSQRA